jgi:hypothetical protein
MSSRAIFSVCSAVAAVALFAGAYVQGRQLKALRTEEQQRLADLEQSALPSEPASQPSESSVEVPSELLRLRNQVSQLSARKRELAGVQEANEKLRAQLIERGTNNPGATKLPAGYIRKSEARLVGYNSPADTIQSFLWALQNRNAEALKQAFAPAERGGYSPVQDPEGLFFRTRDIFGMRIVGKPQQDQVDPTGNRIVQLQVELAPGVRPSLMGMKQIGGQWKIMWIPF